MTHIEELRDVIRKLHGVEATHRESVSVKETFNDETVWEGIVEVFDLVGHSKASTAYAWTTKTGDPANPKHHVTVLHLGPIKCKRQTKCMDEVFEAQVAGVRSATR
jgi:hypothetical protein